MNDVDRDILKNAYYMISLFENAKEEYEESNSSQASANEKIDNNDISNKIPNNIIISNLKLQKLMYFVEAYYMNKYNDDCLYDSEWSAWDYGPVNKCLYSHFKKYGSVEISLESAEKNEIANLPQKNRECIKMIYDIFGGFNAFDLVTLTHLENSPWYEIKMSNKYNFEKLNDSKISNYNTKKWFMETFGKIFDLEKNNE